MYYVYEWYIVETGEIIYVGKGTNNRYRVRKHNKFFNDMIYRFNCDSRIIKRFNTEKEAFEYEFERIRELKEKNQCVCNIYDGGTGGSTEWWTSEIKERYSEKNVMKSESQRKRMSISNPMKNKDVAQKVNSKKKRPIIINDIEYDSVKTVCVKYNVTSSTVIAWCMKGVTKDGESCRYKEEKNTSTYSYINNGQSKPVIYKGVHYKSSSDMAKQIGVSQTTAARWCRQGRDSYGNECRYEDDKRKDIIASTQRDISVIVNDVWYPSKEKARKALGITAYMLTQYLEGKKKDNKYICKYGNQQPSQGKSDNSTLEGSTTNE